LTMARKATKKTGVDGMSSHIPTLVPPTTRMELDLLGIVIQGKADSCLLSFTF
jgi:hypothetical protein